MFIVFLSQLIIEQGALSGLLVGLSLSLWVGFGGPKPPIVRLSQDTSWCPVLNATDAADAGHWNSTATMTDSLVDPLADRGAYYMPLYRLSYMWYAPLGFLATILTAQIVSRIVRKVCPVDKLDPDLLSPCFPNLFRSQQHIRDPVLAVSLSCTIFSRNSSLTS